MSLTDTRPAATSGPKPPPRRRRSLRRALGILGSAMLMLAVIASVVLPGALDSLRRSPSDPTSPDSGDVAADTPRAAKPDVVAESPEDVLEELQDAAPIFGLYTPDSPTDEAAIAAAESAAGADAGIVAYFADATHPLDVGLLDQAAEDGATPLLSLESNSWSTADIASGRYDGELRTLAEKLAQFNDGEGGTVLVRLNHEMNGDWYPWSEAAEGNQAGDYAASWRRIVDIVRETGTGGTTVMWVWSPNILRGGQLDTMVEAYPGDDYVDLIGLTGYGATAYERTAAQTFDPTIRAIRRDISADKPLIITESGASPGKYRTAWTRSLGSWLEDNDDVEAFVWFDFDATDGASTNWRFTDSPQVAAALRKSLSEAGVTPVDATR